MKILASYRKRLEAICLAYMLPQRSLADVSTIINAVFFRMWIPEECVHVQ